MFKWFSANSKNIKEVPEAASADTSLLDQDDLQKARYRLVGVGILFLSVLISLPFLVKSQNYTNKSLNMRLINEQGNSIDTETSSNKTFKKIPMNNIEENNTRHKPQSKRNNNSV